MSREKIRVLDVKLTDGIKMVIEKYQNDMFTRIFTLKAIEKALEKFIMDDEEEDYDPEFNVVLALTQLKADLRVLSFPDGGDEFDEWFDCLDIVKRRK